jgi:hypothetical protein
MTNYQAWLQGWSAHKITKFDASFQEGLQELKHKKNDLEEQLKGLEYPPLLTISKGPHGRAARFATSEARHMIMKWVRNKGNDMLDPEKIQLIVKYGSVVFFYHLYEGLL